MLSLPYVSAALYLSWWDRQQIIITSIMAIWLHATTVTHIVPLVPHAFDRRPPHGFRVEPLDGTELQVELVSPAAHVDVAQVDDAAAVLPGTQHVGTHGPGAVHRIVALHCATFRGHRAHTNCESRQTAGVDGGWWKVVSLNKGFPSTCQRKQF